MNCAICKKKVELNFLEKPFGTYIKDARGEKHLVCTNCQKIYKTKEEILSKL